MFIFTVFDQRYLFWANLAPKFKIICEIIFSKTVSQVLSIFCRSRFINIFFVKSIFSEPWNHQKLNISRPIYFLKISAPYFADLIFTNKLAGFFLQNSFPTTWSFFHDCKITHLGVIFQHKNYYYNFFQEWLFNFKAILKTCFKSLYHKIDQKWWFYSFK